MIHSRQFVRECQQNEYLNEFRNGSVSIRWWFTGSQNIEHLYGRQRSASTMVCTVINMDVYGASNFITIRSS